MQQVLARSQQVAGDEKRSAHRTANLAVQKASPTSMPGWLTLRRSRRSGGYYIEQVAETIFTDLAWNVGELEELALAVADGRPAAGSAGLVVALLDALLALSTVPVISTWCPTCSL